MPSLSRELTRFALRALPMPSRLRELILEVEPAALARLEEFGKRLVGLGNQLQGLATPRPQLTAGATAAPAVEVPVAPAEPPAREARVLVTFSVSHAGTAYGEDVFLAGDDDAVGSWDVTRAFPLRYQGGGAEGAWTAQLPLPGHGAIQYKYLVWNRSRPAATARWELDQPTASGNREAILEGSGMSRADGRFRRG